MNVGGGITIITKVGVLDALRRGHRAGYDRVTLPRDVIDLLFTEIEDLKVEAIAGAAAEVEAIVRPSVMAEANEIANTAIKKYHQAVSVADATAKSAEALLDRMRAARDLVIPASMLVFVIGFWVGALLS